MVEAVEFTKIRGIVPKSRLPQPGPEPYIALMSASCPPQALTGQVRTPWGSEKTPAKMNGQGVHTPLL
jgi:hypothetical protein